MSLDVCLTVLDQSPVHPVSGLNTEDSAKQPFNAGQMSLALAKACDTLAYSRYWVAEHHNSPQFAGPSPEILIASIASATTNMRVGSGGVMLSHYSPYKVAEVFNMLEALFPGRIDLGIGRAPGGDTLALSALAWPDQPQSSDNYPPQALMLKALLDGTVPDGHPWANLHITPAINTAPELWMLGSSGGSAELAGKMGMNLALARFIAPDHCSPEIFAAYDKARTQAGHANDASKMLAIAAFCAETQEEAELLASTAIYRKMMNQSGDTQPLLAPEVVQDKRHSFSASQEAEYTHLLDGYTVGTPERCQDDIQALAKTFGVQEIAVVTVTHSFDARLKSYSLIG